MSSFAFGSFLDCEKGHFSCFFFSKPFPLSALPLVSIRFASIPLTGCNVTVPLMTLTTVVLGM